MNEGLYSLYNKEELINDAVQSKTAAHARKEAKALKEETSSAVSGSILTPDKTAFDCDEASMRPDSWDEYFGQSKIKSNLEVFIDAANSRNDALDHVLLYGPPGLGKTTLAALIAQRLGSELKVTSGPAIERQGDLAAILTNLKPRDVLFIDEIHRLKSNIEEILYPAMEDRALDIILGKGPAARSMRLDLAPFTLVGATTKAGNLASPLRDRFGMIHRLELYSPEEIKQILKRNAAVLELDADEEALDEVSGRCRGTPRIAIRILRRLRDFAQVKGDGKLDRETALKSLKALDIDELGLDATDRNLLNCIAKVFNGGPVGLNTLAFATGEDPVTIEDFYEPYLLQSELLARTSRGRILTPKAVEYLGLDPGKFNMQGPNLFDLEAGDLD